MRFIKLIMVLSFFFALSPPAFAQMPNKIMKVSEVQSDTKAIGFSVFRGVEPEPFDVELRGIVDQGGSKIILAHISGGPMETPLENIGAIQGMSGSPIFTDCTNLNDCIENGTLVGSLSFAIGYFIQDGANAALQPAEYMLGSRLGGYTAISQYSSRSGARSDKVNIGGREFTDLMLPFGLHSDSISIQSNSSDNDCDSSIEGEIKPGSMVTVFLARGSINSGGSGTVTWVDGNKVYIFGHPFYGTGAISYPFTHVAVTDTLQTPLQAYKMSGCHLKTKGTMFADGAHEVAGVIGHSADMLLFSVEVHVGETLVTFSEEVAKSPFTSFVVNTFPIMWAQQLFGDLSYVSVAYRARIGITNQPEVFMRRYVPAQITKNPFVRVMADVFSVLATVDSSGYDYGLESIKIHADFTRDLGVWIKKRSFISTNKVLPGETVLINLVLEEFNTKTVMQMTIPIVIPDDFKDRITEGVSPMVKVVIQSADNFVEEIESQSGASLTDLIARINESYARETNVLYIQQVMPVDKGARELNEANAKEAATPHWSWTQLDQGALRRLPQENMEVSLTQTPLLNHYIDFNETFNVNVDVYDNIDSDFDTETEDQDEKPQRHRTRRHRR